MSIEQIKKGDELTQSLDIVTENIARLKELFPEVFTEGKIDFKVLQEVLGDEIETEEEYYRFTWAGKAQARREAHKPSTGTLRPAKEESLNWDTTENLYIEGDNLEVLKLLQKSYNNKVKMIYIDPPYNTGKDFVYKDNYKDNLKNYQELTGQIDDEGNKLTTNSESDGRYHSNWLSMMYPRLTLARNLLKDDGVIFISIDENEASNLLKCCNEIFGEENFISQAGWQKVYSPKNQARYLSNDYEFVLIYAKRLVDFNIGLLPRTEKMNERYRNIDNDSRGEWKPGDLVAAGERSGGHYIVKSPSGKEYDVPQGKHWAFSEPRMRELLAENRIYFGKDGTSFPSFKQFLSEVKQGRVASSLFSYSDYGHTDEAKKDFIKLFGEAGRTIFETLKPVRLIKNLIDIANVNPNDIVMDFFSGSGTTAESIFNYNLSNQNKNLKFVLVQLPEQTDKSSEAYKEGYPTISEIGKERIRRAGKKILEEKDSKKLDLGFKVLKLDSSNIKSWNGNPDNLMENLFDSQDNIKKERTEEDVLFEILLKYGLDLTLPIEEKVIEGKKVFNVGYGALFICLADGITNKVAEGIGTWKQEINPETCRVIFKDSGFNDIEKTNAVQTLKRFGINEIKSI